MPEFSGVRVVLKNGQAMSFLPGPEHPGIVVFAAALDLTGHWLNVQAIAGSGGASGYLAAQFAESAVLYREPLR